MTMMLMTPSTRVRSHSIVATIIIIIITNTIKFSYIGGHIII